MDVTFFTRPPCVCGDVGDRRTAVGGDGIGMLYLGHRYYYGQDVA